MNKTKEITDKEQFEKFQKELETKYQALSYDQKINYLLTEIKKNNDTVAKFIVANKALTQELTNLTITEINE